MPFMGCSCDSAVLWWWGTAQRTMTRTFGIRYVGSPWLNTSITCTHKEALQFAYGEDERPIEITTSDKAGNTVIVDVVR